MHGHKCLLETGYLLKLDEGQINDMSALFASVFKKGKGGTWSWLMKQQLSLVEQTPLGYDKLLGEKYVVIGCH